MPSQIKAKAHAKITLFLNILGKRADGYHDVRIVMQQIALHDTLEITPVTEKKQITITCNNPDLQTPDNLIAKAYHHFYNQTALPPIALEVDLQKNIPLNAGLGGGSSNAATLIKTLNDLHNNPLNQEDLTQIAASIGSDVPFFLTGGTALIEGKGERITPLPPLPETDIALIKPNSYGISTESAYTWYKEADQYQTKDFTPWQTLIENPNTAINWTQLLHNDFESQIYPRHPDLKTTKQTLINLTLPTLLTGTGATLFSILTPPKIQIQQINEIISITHQTIFTSFISTTTQPYHTFPTQNVGAGL